MKTSDKPLSALIKIIFWFVAINALAGAGSLMFFSSMTDTLFFWPIKPPLNAALFGALYLGGALVVGWIAYKGFWEPARFLVPVLVSAGIFITLTTLVHLDKFTAGIKLVYWLIIYIGAPLLALGIYLAYERTGANWSVAEPVRPLTRIIAVGLGGLLLVVGIIVLIAPGFVVAQWPWPTTPLMVRVFTSWFSAFGVGLLWFIFERDWRRLKMIATMMVAASAFDLLMIVIFYKDLPGVGLNLAVYCFHLAAFGAIGLLMHLLQLNPVAQTVRA